MTSICCCAIIVILMLIIIFGSYPPAPGGGGHTKGVLATDGSTGFWMIHSVPKFPDLTAASFDWSASKIYGQTFLCLSLSVDQVIPEFCGFVLAVRPPHQTVGICILTKIDTVAENIQYMEPHIFTSNLPSSIAPSTPNMADLIRGVTKSGAHSAPFASGFTAFAKSSDWGKDLYEDYVGDLEVESS